MRETSTLGNTTAAASVDDIQGGARRPPVPGLVLIFADGRPCIRLFRVDAQGSVLGRSELRASERSDQQISRKHARFVFQGPDWQVTDLDSRNGTFVDGARIQGATRVAAGSTLRVGGAVVLLVSDIVPFEQHGVNIKQGTVCGPALHTAFEAIALTQSVGLVTTLMITGETGTGKELAARAFHGACGKPDAPFSAVNCATIPKDLAERLLFGSRRGAYSGATDSRGYVQSAHGGTLFLDEVAELPAEVQSKLLRTLETREVMRLGGTSCEVVDVRICAASWRNLRAEVAAGRFREDLYFRLGQPEVQLPALRDRREEIPWHVQQVLGDCSHDRPLSASAAFVDECCCRSWPGNVRELRAEVRLAAAKTVAQAGEVVDLEHLGANAGRPIVTSTAGAPLGAPPADEIATALASAQGNVAEAARSLGVHRNRIRRWLEKHTVDPKALKARGSGR